MKEYACPITEEIVDKEYCDSFGSGAGDKGCKYAHTCKAYKGEKDEKEQAKE